MVTPVLLQVNETSIIYYLFLIILLFSAWGKSFCMLYAVIGIPLCLVMFQSVGERLNNFASWCIKTIKKCLKLRHYESTQTELVIVGTVLAVGVVTGGAAMFHHYESWGYFNCVYYCFITLTTIGKF
jgi:hypothetical protein